MIRDVVSLGAIFILSFLACKNKYIGSFISLLVVVLVIYNSTSTNRFNSSPIFVIVKGISVLIPLLLYANYHYFKDKIILSGLLFSSFMVINLLEVPLLVQFTCSEIMSYINGFFMIILALYTPIFNYNEKLSLFSYNNHWLWSIFSSIILSSFYLFNNFYSLTKYVKLLLFSIIMPTIYALLSGSTEYWLPLRFYSLSLIFVIISSKYLSTLVTNNETITDYTSDKYNNLRIISTIINFICICYLIKNGNSNTFLSSLGF